MSRNKLRSDEYIRRNAVYRRRLGESIRRFRKYTLQASATEVADAAGSPRKTVYDLEHGHSLPLVLIAFYVRKGWRAPASLFDEVFGHDGK